MVKFSPSDAALEGFRISRENPRALLVWTLVYLAAGLVSAVLMVRTGAGAALADLSRMMADSSTPDPAAMTETFGRALPGLLMTALPTVAAQLLIQAALLRRILRPDARTPAIALGRDELMVVGAFVLLGLITMGAVVGMSVILGLLGSVLGPAITPLVFAGNITIVIVLSTRLSLIYPRAVAERSLSVAAAWALTKGRFWSVFGALFMAFVFYVIVLLLGSVVAYALRTLTGIQPEAALTDVAALFAPGEFLARIVEALLQTLGLVLMTAPPAAIYRALTGPKAADAF